MLGIVDDLPQHLVGVHHRGRRVAQHALRSLGARELPHVEHHEQPGGTGLAQEMAQRGQHGARVGAGNANRNVGRTQRRGRRLLAAQPMQHRIVGFPFVRFQPRQAEPQQGGTEILRQPAVAPQIGSQPLIHVMAQQVGRDGERGSQVGHCPRFARPWPRVGMFAEQHFEVALHQAVPWQGAGNGEEQLLHQVDAGAPGLQMDRQHAMRLSESD